ncbi:hypothetical protein [Siphonobacter sp.]|uniref:hypothetical protein n=1 Tax=Siphonobacter sp. TaxID=1869184 RepID=UPI003B3BB784
MLTAEQKRKLIEALAIIGNEPLYENFVHQHYGQSTQRIDRLKQKIESVAQVESVRFWARHLKSTDGLEQTIERVQVIGDLTCSIAYAVAASLRQDAAYEQWNTLDEEGLTVFCSEVVRSVSIRSFITNAL